MDKSVIMIFNNKTIMCSLKNEEYHLDIAQYMINDNFPNGINLYEEMKKQRINWANLINEYYNLIVIITDKPSAIIYLPNSLSKYQILKLKEINKKLDNGFMKSISYQGNAYESDIVVDKLLSSIFKVKSR